MTETATAATTANSAKHSASRLGLPNAEMPKFDPPRMELPGGVPRVREKGVAQAKDNYEKVQAAAGGIACILEAAPRKPHQRRRTTTSSWSRWPRTNRDAVFPIRLRALRHEVRWRKWSALSTEQGREQFDLVTAQDRELWAIADTDGAQSPPSRSRRRRHQGIRRGRAKS